MSDAPAFSPYRNFADNLRGLCARHGSIAAVCRALGMNRQQFNKYLAGSTLPNAASLERICRFFAIDPQSLFRAPGELPASAAPPAPAPGMFLPEMLLQAAALGNIRPGKLREGCYHLYHACPRDPSACIRSALAVEVRGGVTHFTRIAKHRTKAWRQRHYARLRHDGIVVETATSTFLLSVNRGGFGELGLVSIGIEGLANPNLMNGLALFMGTAGNPMALRATLEYRGTKQLLRRTLAEACILPLASPGIPEDVRQSLRTGTEPDVLLPASLHEEPPRRLSRGKAV